MKRTTAKLLPYAVALALSGLATSPAWAQSCPADVADLSALVDEPQLQARINEPLDDIVSNAGGLEAAITQLEQKLAEAQAKRAEVAQSNAPALIRAFDELVLILDRQLSGLQCRGGG